MQREVEPSIKARKYHPEKVRKGGQLFKLLGQRFQPSEVGPHRDVLGGNLWGPA